MTDKHFLQLIKPLDLQHDTKLRLALLKLYFHCFTTLIFYMRSQNSLIAVFPSEIFWQLCVCELKKNMDKNEKMNESKNPWTTVKKTLRAKKDDD